MQTEVVEVLKRCKKCTGATRVLLMADYMTMDGRMVHAEWAEDAEHTRKDCGALETLLREQWPTLW